MAGRGKAVSYLPEGFDREQSRRQGHRPRRRNILIVCEGEKTEPCYFDAFRRRLVGGEGDRVYVVGAGVNTLDLVDKAREIVEERRRSDKPPFYHVWIVFGKGKDGFPDEHFDGSILAVQREDARFKAGVSPHWHTAWSNEAFELWHLLHFQETLGGPVGRDVLCRKLSDRFKSELGVGDGYRKNDPRVFALLESRMQDAIRRGERAFLTCSGKQPHECNPATRVHELVKQLLAYA